MLWRSSLRYLLKHPLQVALSVLGVALGVAVVVGIDLSIQSAGRAFEQSTDRVAGKATHRVVSVDEGLNDSVYTHLRARHGIRKIAPVVEQYVYIPGTENQLHVMGVDPFAEPPFRPYLEQLQAAEDGPLSSFLMHPSGAVLSKGTADELDLKISDTLQVRVGDQIQNVELIGILKGRDQYNRQVLEDLLILDVSTAQEMLGMKGKLSYIDVIIPQSEMGTVKADRIRSLLPGGLELQRSNTRSAAIEKMISAFKTNLQSLSFLALIVGMFLIYNTMTFSVLQRRAQIGRLQALGVTRSEIFRLILVEAGAIGLLGTVVGLVGGYVLGGGLVELVTRTINDIYFNLSVREVAVNAGIILKGVALGLGATLLTALIPAREAARSSPRVSLSRSSVEKGLLDRLPTISAIGFILIGVGSAILLYPSNQIFLGYAGLLPVIIGYALLTPLFVVGMVWFVRRGIGSVSGLSGRMAVQNIKDQLSRSSVAIAALAVAVAATIGVSTSISSFRDTVENWLQYRLQADVFVSVPGNVSRRQARTMDEEVVSDIKDLGEVKAVHTLLRTSRIYEGSVVDMEAIEITLPGRDRYRFKEGDPKQAWNILEKGGVLISEPMAFDHEVTVGDSINLETRRGKRSFPVGGVFYDYSSDIGTILMDRGIFNNHYREQGYTSFSIVGHSNVEAEQLTDVVERKLANRQLSIRSNKELRTLSMQIFDRTFTVTRVLQMLTVLVALIGVFSALMAIQLERTREIGMLRALGFTRRQISGVMLGQTGAMGTIAGLLALPLGFVLAVVLVYVINKRSFGWTLELAWSYEVLWQAMGIAVGAALLSGLYPAIKMAGMNVVRALREE